ncbi:MAG: lamin tail domain-containing protein [Calditrichae bacterium]|nr:lamin tail domain-containing protein [Calditrichota bacterium]MCB9057783.1 lamin tail domain-containing protein [Calditrichia bacterium]
MKKFLLLLSVFILGIFSSTAVAQDLFFSEYAEGSSQNKYVEIYNGTGADVDLSSYSVQGTNNGTAWGDGGQRDITLHGILAAGDVYVIAEIEADPFILAQADTAFPYESPVDYNGDDAIALLKDGVIIDAIGVELNDPGTAWEVAGVANATAEHTLVRKETVTSGNTDWAASAGTNADDSEWIVYDQNTWKYLGIHPGFLVNVTFRVNSSTVHGLTDSSSVVDLRGTVTQWGPGTDMMNVGGDYWEKTIQLMPNTDYQYKYGARDTVSEGLVDEWWENDIPGANYQGDNRLLTTGSEDMVLDLDYLGRGPNNNFPPYTPTDSVDIYIKVNMAGDPIFNPDTEAPSLVGHFPAPDGAGDMWNPNAYKFTRIGDTDYWEYHLKLAQGYVDTVENIKFDAGWPESARGMHMYRFAVTDWGHSENLLGAYFPNNENRVLYLKNTTSDTTLVWKFWNDEPPTGVKVVTSAITWRVSTEALKSMGLFDRGVGDKIEVLGPKSWTPGEGIQLSYSSLSRVWVSSPQEFTQAVGAEITYKYYILWDSSRIDPESPNYIEHLDIGNHGWEEPSSTGGGDRKLVFQDATEQSPDGDFGFDRQFFNGIAANGVIDHPVTVTFNIDMTKAASATDNPDNPLFRPGVDTVWVAWDGELNAFTQGMQRDSVFLMLADPEGDMVYSADFTMNPSDAHPYFSYQFGFKTVYSSDEGDVYHGSGFAKGRRYYQYIKPDAINPDGSDDDALPDPVWPTAYSFPTLEWVASDLYVEEPPDLTQPTAIKDNEQIPNKYELSQNYPNPFNPTTTIKYQLAKKSDVNIAVYNLMGQKVSTLVNGNQNAGVYEVVWNGKNENKKGVASGIYFLKMEAGDFSQIRKMTLIR